MTTRTHLIRLSALAIAMLSSGLALADARLDPKLIDQMAAAAPGDELQVVISYKQSGPLTAAQVDELGDIGITQGVTMHSLPIAGALATTDEVLELATHADVASIYWNAPLRFFNDEARQISGAKRAVDNPTDYGYGTPFTGAGVTVMVNDTGIDATHADLAYGSHVVQNVLGQTNVAGWGAMQPASYVEGLPATDLTSTHGTHCAGILGGDGTMSGELYRGVAPGASLVGYGSGATMYVIDAIGGLDYAATNQYTFASPLRIVSNSWGTTGEFHELDPVNIATYELYKRGIVNVFAAGNDGSAAAAISPYGQAPWVISVSAADKRGVLATFSSRGLFGKTHLITTIDGTYWTYTNTPTITATGVDVASTRSLVFPVPNEERQHDIDTMDASNVPFYTRMTGTSMAAPHVAGIIALMLDANPGLTPMQVRDILERTATNMGGRLSAEVGAGHVNAYAAVAEATGVRTDWGMTVNSLRTFSSSAELVDGGAPLPFAIEFDPMAAVATESFDVTDDVAMVNASAVVGDNTVALVLTDPAGIQYFSPLSSSTSGNIFTSAPGKAGTWHLTVRGYGPAPDTVNGDGQAGPVEGEVHFTNTAGYTNMSDIDSTPARHAIEYAVAHRMIDGYDDGTFRPTLVLKRMELAKYLVMGANIRQALPLDNVSRFVDMTVGTQDYYYAEAVSAPGGALRDLGQGQSSVMSYTNRRFQPQFAVTRATLAYSLVQGLALQSEALASTGPVTAYYLGQRIQIDDQAIIPAGLQGHAQLALDLGIINARFVYKQLAGDTAPRMHAYFDATRQITRADFAVAAGRYQSVYDNAN